MKFALFLSSSEQDVNKILLSSKTWRCVASQIDTNVFDECCVHL
jgi:hypothetical protein